MLIKLVTMANPCSACVITDNLLRGLLDKVAGQMDNITVKTEILNHPRECAGVEGLEIEKLPAIIINGEQVTAGSLLHRRQLIKMIELRME